MIDTRKLTINQRVACYRKIKNLRQEDVAEKMGMRPSTYAQMEREGDISADRLLKISEALEIPPHSLFLGEEIESANNHIPDRIRKGEEFNEGAMQKPQKPAFVEPPIVYSAQEEQIHKVIHYLPTRLKKEVFDFVMLKYRQTRGEV